MEATSEMGTSMRDELRESLLQRTREAAAQTAPASLSAEPPQAGDILQCAAPAEAMLEWAVLAVDPERSRLLVVPADINPETGPGDMEVPADAACGPLVLRCAWATWVPSRTFASGLRTGRLTAELCEQAAAMAEMIIAGGEGPFRAAAADQGTFEYAEWIERTVAPACAQLRAAAPHRPARRLRSATRWLAAAAVLLLAASAALLTSLELDRRHLRAALDGTESARRELEDQLRASIEEPHQQQQPSPLADQPGAPAFESLTYAWLRPAAARRGPSPSEPLELPQEARFLVVLLELPDQEAARHSEPASRYRLQLLDDDSRKIVWETSALRPAGASEICAALPTRVLQPGSFSLVLSRTDEQDPRVVSSYRLELG
jgi:hypothetical protein